MCVILLRPFVLSVPMKPVRPWLHPGTINYLKLVFGLVQKSLLIPVMRCDIETIRAAQLIGLHLTPTVHWIPSTSPKTQWTLARSWLVY
jgi:hypothetical protein